MVAQQPAISKKRRVATHYREVQSWKFTAGRSEAAAARREVLGFLRRRFAAENGVAMRRAAEAANDHCVALRPDDGLGEAGLVTQSREQVQRSFLCGRVFRVLER